MSSIDESAQKYDPGGTSVADLTAFVSRLPHPAAVTDRTGQLLYRNELLADLIPGNSGEGGASSRDLPTLLHEQCLRKNGRQDVENLRALISQSCESGSCVMEDVDKARFEISTLPQIGRGGRVEYWIWKFENLRQTERLREHAAHSEKMQVISRLAGGMAHEFNNLLTVVLGNLELIRTNPAASAQTILSHVDSAESAALRASQLIHELRRFASRDLPTQERQRIVPIVRRVCKILAGMAPQQVQVTVTSSADETRLRASVSADRLVEALLKLGVNAIEAIGGKPGRIEFSVSEIGPPVRSESVVQIAITDNGGGMCQDAQERAFEPFFTTKAPTAAVGLGLAMVYSLVEEMGGTIGIDQSTSAGTRVSITFPLVVEFGDSAVTEDSPFPLPRRILQIAIVDNEPGVLSLGRGMFRHLGHEVQTFASGSAILSSIESDSRFDLIILDNALSGMTGRTAYGRIRQLEPEVPVVICSGHNVDLTGFVAENVRPPDGIIAKPFSLDAVSAMLDEVV